MDGFKNTTRTQYSTGYAKGGSVKGAAKVGIVMHEFGKGKLHSGSKKGPEVSNPKQAIAIALSEGRKADAPYKKGGKVKGPVIERAKTVAMRTKDTPTMNAQEMRTMQRYKAAMASRPNREPLVSPDIDAIKGALQSATRGAAPPVAAPPPMMGAPAMKKGGKVLKKEDGGAIVADAESDATAREQAEGAMAQPATAPAAEASTFGSAFRSARAAGANAFTWRGKRYTTDLAAPARPKAAAPVRDQVSPAANIVPQKLRNTAYSVRAGMEKELADAATRSKAAAPVAQPSAASNASAPEMVATTSTPPPSGPPKTFRESLERVGKEERERNALYDARMAADAKRRGDAVKGTIKGAVDFFAGRAPLPGAPKTFKEALGRVNYNHGGKVTKKEDGGMASSIRSAKDYNAADKDFVSARSEQLGKVIGKAEGGKADLKQDKAMLAAAIHKHERHDHPGKPLTKLRKGGMAC
jgi:hypothetical protein